MATCKHRIAATGLLLATGVATVSGVAPVRTGAVGRSRPAWSSAATPLYFEPNRGQTDPSVRFLARGSGGLVFLKAEEAVVKVRPAAPRTSDPWGREVREHPVGHSLPSRAVHIRFSGARPGRSARPEQPLPGRVNYLLGNDPGRWITGLPTYGRVRFDGIYPGVDVVYYGRERSLEYDLVVAPGADPDRIRMEFAGGAPELQPDGALALRLPEGAVVLEKPVLYQTAPEGRTPVEGSYRLLAEGRVGFRIGAYDRSRELVIDPLLQYSGLIGGTGLDTGTGAAVDEDGFATIAGYTESTNFPTADALRATAGGGGDAFVARFSPDGSELVYATYLGGSGQDAATDVEVDATGAAYVTGTTNSTNFPTAAPLQGARAGDTDAFLAKLSPDGGALTYSTYLGGAGRDGSNGVAVNPAGEAIIAGFTASRNFPTTAGAIQPVFGGDFDGFV
ncbi:MAG: hypothetical protein FJX77_16570, partial [Armatimonadetes bacterium]|nr:hypothetical protein [Armatimonadota bacterium]